MKGERVTDEQFGGEVRVMWPNGPSRRWAQAKIPGASMPLDSGGYAGNYVCQGCGRSCDGVYAPNSSSKHAGKWICGGCRNAEIAENATPREKRVPR
jgi:hypothetical protein